MPLVGFEPTTPVVEQMKKMASHAAWPLYTSMYVTDENSEKWYRKQKHNLVHSWLQLSLYVPVLKAQTWSQKYILHEKLLFGELLSYRVVRDNDKETVWNLLRPVLAKSSICANIEINIH
jgi:hypothetical protein